MKQIKIETVWKCHTEIQFDSYIFWNVRTILNIEYLQKSLVMIDFVKWQQFKKESFINSFK